MTRTCHRLAAATLGSVVLLLYLTSLALAEAERRVALVIGNSAYQHAPRLDNPQNDAKAVADLLRKAEFEVVTAKTDLGILEFKRTVREFVNTTRGADIAVVFYAGHGIEVGGVNYMIPVDAKLASDLDAEDEAVDLDRIVRALEPAKRFRLVIIDACRDNPFGNRMQRTLAVRAVSRGLAKTEPTSTDTLIAYAARAGSTAQDGEEGHSPFTQALLRNLIEPGLDVRIAFGRIRDEVLKRTGNQQEPFVYGSLGGATLSLVPQPKAPVVAEPAPSDIRADYQMAERVGTIEAWDSFLAVHRSGFYAELAKQQRAKFGGSTGAPPPSDQQKQIAALPPEKAPAALERASPDRIAWDKVRDSDSIPALRDFVRRFPSSPLALNAKQRIELLEQTAAQRREEELEKQRAERQRREDEQRAKAAKLEDEKAQREALKKAATEKELELVRTAQRELKRIGCYAGRETGALDSATTHALEDYYSKTGQPRTQIKLTDELITELTGHPEIESCIAALPKPAPVAHTREHAPAPTAKPTSERASAPARAEPTARAQAAAPRRLPVSGSGGIIGIGIGF